MFTFLTQPSRLRKTVFRSVFLHLNKIFFTKFHVQNINLLTFENACIHIIFTIEKIFAKNWFGQIYLL